MTSAVDRERFLVHPGRALWAGGGLLALVVVLAVVMPTGPVAVDRSWSEAMADVRTPLLTHLALAFDWLGHGVGRIASLALVGLLLLHRRRLLALAAFAAAETAAPLLSTLLKALVGRPRPTNGLVHALGASFPSGHVVYAGTTCVALVLLFTAPGPRRGLWWGVAAVGIAGMAWSRTYLQVHWLSDVVGGSLLGIGIAFLVFGAAQRSNVKPSFSRRGELSA